MTDFESAMKKVSDVLHAAARKSGEILENTKISYNISTERDKLAKCQSRIGAKFYKLYKEGGETPDFIADDLQELAAIEETIRAMEKTISDSKPYKFCSECGAKLELSDIYCAKCGAKQHDVTASPQADDKGCCDECCDGDDDCCDGGDSGEGVCCEDKGCCDGGGEGGEEKSCCDGGENA